MGDLKEISFMEAWQSPDFQALRQAHLNRDVSNTVCRDCVSYA
ncbi:MAG: SPASM domain-containing protein, partial [Rhodospirillaceae bacterium]|nr:SPASM domain-containing protein [Rhodospirillaceae bacterium]